MNILVSKYLRCAWNKRFIFSSLLSFDWSVLILLLRVLCSDIFMSSNFIDLRPSIERHCLTLPSNLFSTSRWKYREWKNNSKYSGNTSPEQRKQTYIGLTIPLSKLTRRAIDPTFIRAGLYAKSFFTTILYFEVSSLAMTWFSNCSDWAINPCRLLIDKTGKSVFLLLRLDTSCIKSPILLFSFCRLKWLSIIADFKDSPKK